MKYIICDNDNYIFRDKQNKYTIVNNIDSATKWEDIQKVNNILKNNCMGKHLKEFKWETKCVSQENEIVNTPAKPIELNYDILEKVKEIHTFIKELEERKLYLIEEQRKIDLEIVDIEHAAEFYNLNASQGYKLYKLLHDSRIKRREIKDELQKINLTLGTSIKSINMENLERSILGMDNRQYTPRINKELFGV